MTDYRDKYEYGDRPGLLTKLKRRINSWFLAARVSEAEQIEVASARLRNDLSNSDFRFHPSQLVWNVYPMHLKPNTFTHTRMKKPYTRAMEERGFFMNPWLSLWGQKHGLLKQTSPHQVVPITSDKSFSWNKFYKMAEEARQRPL